MSALKVLVVEDDIGLCGIYDRVLGRMGCEVDFARDGHHALQLLSVCRPDLIFLDIYLPIINGIAVLEAISASPALAKTRVVVTSSSREYERQVLTHPNTEFILKPILPTQIREIAARMMASSLGA
jgi:CheY-like chemotaxis protein